MKSLLRVQKKIAGQHAEPGIDFEIAERFF